MKSEWPIGNEGGGSGGILVGGGGSGAGGNGGGSGGGPGFDPYATAANTREFGTAVQILSEGPIAGPVNGLKSFLLEGTPVQNADNSMNFSGLALALVLGTNTQAHIPGMSSSESEVAVDIQVKVSTGAVSRTINTTGLSAIRVRISLPQLFIVNTTSGAKSGADVQMKIERQSPNYTPSGGSLGAWEIVPLEGDGWIYGGPFESKFTKSWRVDTPAAGPWTLRVTRMWPDAPDSYTRNDTFWEAYTEIFDGKVRTPYSAKVVFKVDSKQFRSIPKLEVIAKGVLVEVPANYDPEARTYDISGPGTTMGIWDGTMKVAWTDNPAWLWYALATNKRWGAGAYLDSGKIDRFALYALGQTCDQLVSDGKGDQEPRFRCSLYLQSQDDAIKLLSDLASVFRGMAYWAGGQVTVVQDAAAGKAALFSNSNVKGGRFSYSGSARKARHNAALVSWVDPDNGYQTSVEYVEDHDAIARYGYNPIQVPALGSTSQGQAQRVGMYILTTEKLETESEGHTAALEGMVLRPGDIYGVRDQFRLGKGRNGGRITSATPTTVNLDGSVVLESGTTYDLSVWLPSGAIETRAITTAAGTRQSVTVASAFSETPDPQAQWSVVPQGQEVLYRALSIRKGEGLDYEITGIQHDPTKYALVEEITITNAPARPLNNLAAPTSLVATDSTRIEKDKLVQVLAASWVATAQGYLAEVSQDYGPWRQMNICAAAAVIEGITAGSWRVRVKAIYATGTSNWVEVTHVVAAPTVMASDAAAAAAAAAGAAADAAAANTELANIASDAVLTADEKPRVIQDRDVLATERAGIDAHAVVFTCAAVDSAKSMYDTASSALTTYLATLTAPYLWTDLTQGHNTAIIGETFRQKFADVYAARQALLNAIADRAKTLADTAQTSANSALAQIADLASDGILSVGEKPPAIMAYAGLSSQVTALRVQALSVGATLPTQHTLGAYLASLGPYSWNDTAAGHDTTIPVPATWTSKWNEIYAEIANLTANISSKLNGDITAIETMMANIADDFLITEQEKPEGRRWLAAEKSRWENAYDLAVSLGMTTEANSYRDGVWKLSYRYFAAVFYSISGFVDYNTGYNGAETYDSKGSVAVGANLAGDFGPMHYNASPLWTKRAMWVTYMAGLYNSSLNLMKAIAAKPANGTALGTVKQGTNITIDPDGTINASGALGTTATWGSISGTLASQADMADLAAIEVLAGTSGLLKKIAANTWALDNTTYVATGDSRLADSRPASDVFAWAKASVKPSYIYSEVGALAVAGTAADSSKLGGQLPAYYQTALGYTPINKAGDTGIGALSMGALTATDARVNGAASAYLWVNGAAGNEAGIVLQRAGVSKWELYKTAGSDSFDIYSFGYGTALSINYTTAAASFNGSVAMGALTATTGAFNNDGIRIGGWLGLGVTYSSAQCVFGSNIYVDIADTVQGQLRYQQSHSSYGHAFVQAYYGQVDICAKREGVTGGAVVAKNIIATFSGVDNSSTFTGTASVNGGVPMAGYGLAVGGNLKLSTANSWLTGNTSIALYGDPSSSYGLILAASGAVTMNGPNVFMNALSATTGAFSGPTLYVGNGSAPTSFYTNGNASGANGGSCILAMVNGVTSIAIGNRSALVGGAMDSSPMLYSSGTVYTNYGMSIGGAVSATSATLSSSINLPNNVFVYSNGFQNLCIETAHGASQIGMLNTSYCHFNTAATSGFYFYQTVNMASYLNVVSGLDITGGQYGSASLLVNSVALANFRASGHIQLAIAADTAPAQISLQVKHSTADGNSYGLQLNPLGGLVSIGGSGLLVTGSIVTTSDIVKNSYLWMAQDTIGQHMTNAHANIYLNYTGYAGGTTQFRSLWVGDGKTARVAFFDGITKDTTLDGSLFSRQLTVQGDYTNLGGWRWAARLQAPDYPMLTFEATSPNNVSRIGNNGDGSLYFYVGATNGTIGALGLVINANGTSSFNSNSVSMGDLIQNNAAWHYGYNTAGGLQPLIRSRGMGYAPNPYGGVQIGQTGDHIAMFIDPGTIAGGAFGGNTNELMMPNAFTCLVANTAGTDWQPWMLVNNSATTFGYAVTAASLTSNSFIRGYGLIYTSASIPGDVIGYFVNSSATGYGVEIQGACAGHYILSLRDYAGNRAWNVDGSGLMTAQAANFAGNVTVAMATNARVAVRGGGAVNGFLIESDSLKQAWVWNYENTVTTFGNNGAAYLTVTAAGAATFASTVAAETYKLLDGYSILPYTTLRDFPAGTLIETGIDYSTASGDSWLLEITGNSYGSEIPFHFKAQGYIYASTIINFGGFSTGPWPGMLKAFLQNGHLCFWMPTMGYWQGFQVSCKIVTTAGVRSNQVISATNSAFPGGVTKIVDLSPKIVQVYHSGNVGTNAATFQAAIANATAPMVGTYAEMIAFTPGGILAYWYATDVAAPDGLNGRLYRWSGSAWVDQGNPSVVVGRITAGVISAGAIGAQALNATIVMTSVLTSTGYTPGNASAAPYGFKLSGNPFTTTYLTTSGAGTSSTYMELGSEANFGGYPVGDVARVMTRSNRILNPDFWGSTSNWGGTPQWSQVLVSATGVSTYYPTVSTYYNYAFSQCFSSPAYLRGAQYLRFTPTLTISCVNANGAGTIVGRITVSLKNFTTGTTTQIYQSTGATASQTGSGSTSWAPGQQSIDVSSYLSSSASQYGVMVVVDNIRITNDAQVTNASCTGSAAVVGWEFLM
jgi:predicted phage tail protein